MVRLTKGERQIVCVDAFPVWDVRFMVVVRTGNPIHTGVFYNITCAFAVLFYFRYGILFLADAMNSLIYSHYLLSLLVNLTLPW